VDRVVRRLASAVTTEGAPMAWLRNLSLQKRIGLLSVVCLAVALGTFSFVGIQSLNESTARILDERLTISRILANDLDETLTHVATHLQGIASSNTMPDANEFISMADALRQVLADTGIPVRNVILTDANAEVTNVEPTDEAILQEHWVGLPEMKRSLNSGNRTISNVLADPTNGTEIVLVSAPIVGDRGDVLGLLSASIDIGGATISNISQIGRIGNTGYVEIVDSNGIVVSRTMPGVPPTVMEKSDHAGHFADLIREGQAVVGTCHRCHEVNQQIERKSDVLAFAPLSAAPWGVAIRQSEEEALAPTRTLQKRFAILGIVMLAGAFFLVWLVTQGMVKPIRALTMAAKRVTVGDFEAVTPMERNDEIGQLSRSFYVMEQELAKSRDDLVSRNTELAALNSISLAVSQSLDLKNLLESALSNVLNVTRTDSAWILLRDAASDRLEVATRVGEETGLNCHESNKPSASCICHRVLKQRHTVMVNSDSQCPTLTADARCGSAAPFVAIPLQTGKRVLGVMNVACSQDECFNARDFELFDSIGYHVGLAIENSILYEGAKEEEELRGTLLSSVINAQEEERKRISRELHDESGQTLAAAAMSLESIEDLVPPEHVQLMKKVQGVRSLVSRTLEDIRRLTRDLRPMALDDLGLPSAIRTHVKNRLESVGIRVIFEGKGLEGNGRLSPAIETALFRIVQEATNNILRHASARNVLVSLTAHDGKIAVVVEDDGVGFHRNTVMTSAPRTQSLGLVGMKERATILGGTFAVQSHPNQGTRVVVEIPTVYRPSGDQHDKYALGR
jgi:signal transduction histidine kinase